MPSARPTPHAPPPPVPPEASLALRRVAIDTRHDNVVYLHRDCPLYRAQGLQALAKVEVQAGSQRLLATLNVTSDPRIVQSHELGLSQACFDRLGLPAGHAATLAQAEPPASMAALRRKIDGERLQAADYAAIISDVAALRYSKIELTAFVVACNRSELDREEVYFLTEAMIQAGRRLDWQAPLVVDKHCIGGIPGNRTSMLVVPIVTAFGLLFPKTSSRAITSPAGTADTMEVLAEVDLPSERLTEIVRTHRGCLAWGGTAELSPADDVLISVERPLAIDSPGQMVASILSKKVAAGATHLLLDIPVGPSAKVRSLGDAQRLRRLFEYVAQRLSLSLDVVITDGRQPIGRGIGPVLEARDVMQVLHQHPDAPADLRQKALQLAGRLIECSPQVRGGQGYAIAAELLASGRALAQMQAIIAAQGAHLFDLQRPALGRLSFEVCATQAGLISMLDNAALAHIASLAGAPTVPGAGVDLLRRLGEPVAAGDPVYRVHAAYPADLQFARQRSQRHPGFAVGSADQIAPHCTEF